MSKPRRKKARPVSGWIVFDKPVGMGSTEAVSKMRWLFNAEKAGHAGTLDPLASGMLPIALGEATKTVPYVMDGGKTYQFTVTWGSETTTDDLEGTTTQTSDLRPSREAIEALLPKYTGDISQIPPQFSAIKIDGARAYDLARSGETVELQARVVVIEALRVTAHDGETTTFEVECGKGTYVRSLARDLGRDVGCFGHVTFLRRLDVYPFATQDLVTLVDLEEAQNAGGAAFEKAIATHGADENLWPIGLHIPDRYAAIDALLQSPAAALLGMTEVMLNPDQARRIRLGNPVMVRGPGIASHAEEAFATERGQIIAIGEIEHGEFRPRRVFTGKTNG
ncbi:MAG: tRNA pseudouridine(55) synthase TruB [Notoacmeibacter sp.]